jgi:hypothetical protein
MVSLRPEAREEARRFTEAAVEQQMKQIENSQEPKELEKLSRPMTAEEFCERANSGTYDFDWESKLPQNGDAPYATDGPNKGEPVVAIQMATPDRPYNMYHGMKTPISAISLS